jgi:hypothetical protein
LDRKGAINENDRNYTIELKFDGNHASVVTDSVTPFVTSDSINLTQLFDLMLPSRYFVRPLDELRLN